MVSRQGAGSNSGSCPMLAVCAGTSGRISPQVDAGRPQTQLHIVVRAHRHAALAGSKKGESRQLVACIAVACIAVAGNKQCSPQGMASMLGGAASTADIPRTADTAHRTLQKPPPASVPAAAGGCASGETCWGKHCTHQVEHRLQVLLSTRALECAE